MPSQSTYYQTKLNFELSFRRDAVGKGEYKYIGNAVSGVNTIISVMELNSSVKEILMTAVVFYCRDNGLSANDLFESVIEI